MYFQVVKHIHAKDTIEEAPPLGPHRNRRAASPGNSPVSPVVWEPLGIMACFNNFKFQNPWNYGENRSVSVFHTELSAIYPVKVAGHLQNSVRNLFLQPEKPPWLYHSDPSRRTPGRSWAFVPPAPFVKRRCRSITGMSRNERRPFGRKKNEDVSENNGELNLKVSKGCLFGLLKMNMEMVCLVCFAQ